MSNAPEDEKDPEQLYFDGERYYTREEFFNDDDDAVGDEQDDTSRLLQRSWLKKTIAGVLAVILIGNLLAFWPQVYNLAAIQFLSKSRELAQNENVELYQQSIVVVSAGNSKGTGFMVTDDGYIVTNDHVIKNESKIYVRFDEGERVEAEVILLREDIDIAILKIDTQNLDRPALEMDKNPNMNIQRRGDTASNMNLYMTPYQGEAVYFIGNPFFFNFIANEGQVVGLADLVGWDRPVMLIDAPIYKGNSGSPVINQDGIVIAVVFATIRMEHEGTKKKLGLAVPVEYFNPYIDK